MVTIRLSRVGKRKQPTYRFVVQEKGRDPWGSHIEILGHFNPRTKPSTVTIKTDRVKHWLEHGATVSDTVWNLFIDQKLVTGEKRRIVKLSKKRQTAMAETKVKAEAAAVAEAEAKKTKPAETAEAPAAAPAEDAAS